MPPRPSDDVFTYRLGPDETVVEGVVTATAAVSGTDPVALDPIHTVVDPDALDALFRSTANGEAGVRFHYNGCEVEVASDGLLELRPTE